MALPTWVQVGSNFSSTGAPSLSYPAGTAIGDMVVCMITHRDEAVGHPTPSGASGVEEPWIEIGTTVTQGANMLTVYYSYLTSATPSGGTVSDSGNRTSGRVFCVRHASGRPEIHGWQDSTDSTSDTTGSATGFTTTVADCFIAIMVSGDAPDANTTAEFSGFTNGALGTLTERSDNSVLTGGGGSYALATGTLAVAGAIGATTYTHVTACVKACKVLAIMPPSPPAPPPLLVTGVRRG